DGSKKITEINQIPANENLNPQIHTDIDEKTEIGLDPDLNPDLDTETDINSSDDSDNDNFDQQLSKFDLSKALEEAKRLDGDKIPTTTNIDSSLQTDDLEQDIPESGSKLEDLHSQSLETDELDE